MHSLCSEKVVAAVWGTWRTMIRHSLGIPYSHQLKCWSDAFIPSSLISIKCAAKFSLSHVSNKSLAVRSGHPVCQMIVPIPLLPWLIWFIWLFHFLSPLLFHKRWTKKKNHNCASISNEGSDLSHYWNEQACHRWREKIKLYIDVGILLPRASNGWTTETLC